MAHREKIQETGIVKDNTKFLYYIKDGKVFRVPKKQSGILDRRSEMELDARLRQDPAYIYFVDEDGDIARVPRATGGGRGKKKHGRASKKQEPRKKTSGKTGSTGLRKKPARR